MKTLNNILEGFFNTSGSGWDEHIKKVEEKIHDIVAKKYHKLIQVNPETGDVEPTKNAVNYFKDNILYIENFFGYELGVKLKGFNKISISRCKILGTLKGLPDELEFLRLNDLPSLETLVGIPKKIHSIDIVECGIKNLEGIKHTNILFISSCKDFESFKGCPKKLQRLDVRDCQNIKNTRYVPQDIYKLYWSRNNLDIDPKEFYKVHNFVLNGQVIQSPLLDLF